MVRGVNMKKLGRLRTLICGCCGSYTRGRQWWNSDNGYGLCPECADWKRERGGSKEGLEEGSGIEGIHWGKSLQKED